MPTRASGYARSMCHRPTSCWRSGCGSPCIRRRRTTRISATVAGDRAVDPRVEHAPEIADAGTPVACEDVEPLPEPLEGHETTAERVVDGVLDRGDREHGREIDQRSSGPRDRNPLDDREVAGGEVARPV